MDLTFRYPKKAILLDGLRAVTGLTVFGGALLFVSLSSVMVWPLGGLVLLFGAFAVRTCFRHQTRYVIDDTGIHTTGPIRRSIRWDAVQGVRLRFFSTWRDRSSGWMQLAITGGGAATKVDSTLDGFGDLVRIVLGEVRSRGLAIDDTTRHNCRALGLTLPPEVGD